MTIDTDLKAAVVQKIREYIAKNHISREEFARRAKIGKSTVDKIVTGIFTEKTLMQIEAQLGLNLLR